MSVLGYNKNFRGGYNFQLMADGQPYMISFDAEGAVRYVKSAFSRITNNVFGNGSRNVEQSGWRELRPDGATYKRVLKAFAEFKRIAAAAQLCDVDRRAQRKP